MRHNNGLSHFGCVYVCRDGVSDGGSGPGRGRVCSSGDGVGSVRVHGRDG